ncbi:TPA: MFS transporter [Yersinia enterocolitica]|uniref:MFS transporter n=1 Tax=Yersinia enterocolitica TaxID=630 RepID=UPI000327E3CE|nr:MFS transporter [Yersinia enterocolitica]AOF15162.1 MFS transporter [Yersinia enterocolitica]AOF19013.1 MFS transporter [Yersinia enterocolitica]AOF23548.1 MFS transporter [Yersinia enterocolitica]AOF27190.1 MFS transporter [Yersinia enterocolitica]AOF31365.1 MFS transporter [Yersinia enterocolitica]
MKANTRNINSLKVEDTNLRKTVLSLSLPMLLSSLATSIANVGLPTLTQVLNASFQDAQWVVLAYLLAITTSAISIGRMGDIIDKRLLLKTGIGLFTVASVGCALAPTMGILIAARFIQGLGAAAMMTLTLALVGETDSPEKTGRVMGMLGTVSALGTALGPSLGGILIAGFGWPAIFLINIPLGLLALLLISRYLPCNRTAFTQPQSGFDPIGMLLLGLTLALYALSMTWGHDRFDARNLALLAAAIGVGLFSRAEKRAKYPLIQTAMLRHSVLRGSLIMSTLVTTIMMSTLIVGPFYLSRGLGLPAQWVGLAMSAGPIVAALGGIPAGYAVDKLGAQIMVTGGLVGVTFGATILAIIPTGWGVLGYVVPVCLITASYAIFQTANNTLMIKSVGADQRGVVSGMLNLSRNLGLITGASVMGAIFAFASTAQNIQLATTTDIIQGMQLTYGVAALLAAIALGISAIHLRNKFNQ